MLRFHQKARYLSPANIRVTRVSLSQFLAEHAPTVASKQDAQRYLSAMAARCRPATVWTARRRLVAFFKWLQEEGDIAVNPMHGIPRPIVPPIKVGISPQQSLPRSSRPAKAQAAKSEAT